MDKAWTTPPPAAPHPTRVGSVFVSPGGQFLMSLDNVRETTCEATGARPAMAVRRPGHRGRCGGRGRAAPCRCGRVTCRGGGPATGAPTSRGRRASRRRTTRVRRPSRKAIASAALAAIPGGNATSCSPGSASVAAARGLAGVCARGEALGQVAERNDDLVRADGCQRGWMDELHAVLLVASGGRRGRVRVGGTSRPAGRDRCPCADP